MPEQLAMLIALALIALPWAVITRWLRASARPDVPTPVVTNRAKLPTTVWTSRAGGPLNDEPENRSLPR